MKCVSPELLDKYVATLVTISMTLQDEHDFIFTEDFILLTTDVINHQHPAEREIKFEVANFCPDAELNGDRCDNHWLSWHMAKYQPLPYEVAVFMARNMSMPVYISETVQEWEDGTVE